MDPCRTLQGLRNHTTFRQDGPLKNCCGSALFSKWIRIQHFRLMRIRLHLLIFKILKRHYSARKSEFISLFTSNFYVSFCHPGSGLIFPNADPDPANKNHIDPDSQQ
jgi:hypothetical protein